MEKTLYLSKNDIKNLLLKFKRETESHQHPKTKFCKKYGDKLSYYEMEDKWMEENIDIIPTRLMK